MEITNQLLEQFIAETPIEILTCKRCTRNEIIRKADEEKGFRDRLIEISAMMLIEEDVLKQIREAGKLDDKETSIATGFNVKEVKRLANPGEYIKVVNSDGCRINDYENGDILLVKLVRTVAGKNVAHYKLEDFKYLYENEYVVLEGYVPEEGEL